MSLLSGEPEIVPIGVNSVSSFFYIPRLTIPHFQNDEPSGSNSDSAAKKAKSVGDYHECQLCGVRVKTPRSGRWNLQMHVIALHCVGRQYKCKQCDYLDYRKSTMRKHTVSQHGSDIPPHNITWVLEFFQIKISNINILKQYLNIPMLLESIQFILKRLWNINWNEIICEQFL